MQPIAFYFPSPNTFDNASAKTETCSFLTNSASFNFIATSSSVDSDMSSLRKYLI
ncbi:MAG: hypothetical protein JXB50_12285 [Spirochaetes bacterium]|nr:hypothetical protein [Spirochaetota bacterium]